MAVALVVASGGSARADTDPASTYLISNQVFLSSQPTAMSSTQRRLVATVAAANRAGFRIRVAVISSDYDLGSVPGLWDKPRTYARFLGLELSSQYMRQRLLVVMPNGFGFNWAGHGTAATYALLATVPVHSAAGAGLAGAAEVAVRRLARASGVALPPSRATSSVQSARQGSAGTLAIIGAVAGGIAALFALALVIMRARRRRARRPERREVARSSRVSRELRWAIPGLVVLCAVAVAAPILAFGRSPRHPSAPVAYSPVSLVSPPAASWGAGDRRAPNFSLRDQNGRPVSVAANRGRPVIVTFVDPLCRNFCPLEAQVLNQMERHIPTAHRPVILAVNVDVYANARRYLLLDDREWRLVPEWRWAIGRPEDLAAVWKNYRIEVKVTTSRINGVVTYGIDHTEAAYVLDATGHERALFTWPFNPQDLEHVLGQLA
jgi:cytochrome oxidase Cu insertion factor (SCO1/SenC/PrrC family)